VKAENGVQNSSFQAGAVTFPIVGNFVPGFTTDFSKYTEKKGTSVAESASKGQISKISNSY